MRLERVTAVDVLPLEDGPQQGPLIAVAVPLDYPGISAGDRRLVVQFTRSAVATLNEVGARVQLIDMSSDESVVAAAYADGVLLLGGGDIDPSMYGHRGPVPNLYGVDQRSDARTLEVIRLGERNGAPMLGVCRGSQMLNIAFGGTLIPDLGDSNPHRGVAGGPPLIDDPVEIVEHSRLSQLLPTRHIIVRNGHHQAVSKVGTGFKVAARGIDGVVEATEHEEKWIFGVQWHPEDPQGSARDRTALFTAFVERAAVHASQKVCLMATAR